MNDDVVSVPCYTCDKSGRVKQETNAGYTFSQCPHCSGAGSLLVKENDLALTVVIKVNGQERLILATTKTGKLVRAGPLSQDEVLILSQLANHPLPALLALLASEHEALRRRVFALEATLDSQGPGVVGEE